MEAVTIYLTEKAFKGLQETALRQKYIYINAERNRGLGKFLWDLVASNPNPEDWKDTRPSGISDFEIDELEGGLLPQWDEELGDYRVARNFEAPLSSISSSLARIVDHWGIVRRKSQGTQKRYSESNRRSEFFEAVGLGWLTPRSYPIGDKWKLERKTELPW